MELSSFSENTIVHPSIPEVKAEAPCVDAERRSSISRQHARTMTSNPTGNAPPLPPGNRSFPVPPSRPAPQAFQQTPRSWPRQTFLQTNTPSMSRDFSEPALKRQKLEDTGRVIEPAGSGDLAKPVSSQIASHRGRGFAPFKTDTGHSEQRPQSHQPPPFPLRPGRYLRPGGPQKCRPLAFERAARRDAVPVKPYIPKPPSLAPRLHKNGKQLMPLKPRGTY